MLIQWEMPFHQYVIAAHSSNKNNQVRTFTLWPTVRDSLLEASSFTPGHNPLILCSGEFGCLKLSTNILLSKCFTTLLVRVALDLVTDTWIIGGLTQRKSNLQQKVGAEGSCSTHLFRGPDRWGPCCHQLLTSKEAQCVDNQSAGQEDSNTEGCHRLCLKAPYITCLHIQLARTLPYGPREIQKGMGKSCLDFHSQQPLCTIKWEHESFGHWFIQNW